MYKKKSKMPMIVAVVVVVALFAIVFLFQYFASNRNSTDEELETETETEAVTEAETESLKHDILIFNSSSGTVDFDFEPYWLLSEESDEEENIALQVEENTLVTFMITPNEGKELSSVDVLDYDMKEISTVLRSASGVEGDYAGQMRVSFVMPDCDIFVYVNYADTDEEETEPGASEEETEDSTYGLILHNLTSDVITSFNGQFDEEKFLHALGDALHVDSSRSEYRTVTDVYFGDLVENNTEKLSYEIYFNNDILWKVLATYYPSEDAYLFTEIAAEEADGEELAEEETADADNGVTLGTYEGVTSTSGTGTVSDASATTTSNAGAATTSQETTTSFNIMSVSTVFLKFVGDEDAFYQAAFDYVIEKGLTGDIVGTMSDYEIDPENQTSTIRLMLNTGATITGTYNKTNNTYSFSGL